jgi:hypothetical protein
MSIFDILEPICIFENVEKRHFQISKIGSIGFFISFKMSKNDIFKSVQNPKMSKNDIFKYRFYDIFSVLTIFIFTSSLVIHKLAHGHSL